jgi:phosphate transport system permease protein
MATLVNLGTWLVLGSLLAIPLFLVWGLQPWSASTIDWQRLGLLFSGSLRAATCAVMVAVPLGLATAMFSAHFAAPRLRAWLKPALEILDALPTVVLGLVATATLAPWLKTHVASVLALIVIVPCALLAAGFAFGTRVRHDGWLPLWLLPLLVAFLAIVIAFAALGETTPLQPSSPWNASLVGIALGMAALPLVYSVAEDALFLVPSTQTQAAFALGATRWQALATVVLPAAGSGLIAAVLLGFSRCFGETMIVLMASGNTAVGGFDPLAGLRSISAELALGLPDAAPHGAAYRNLLLAALILLATSVLFSLIADALRERLHRRLKVDGAQ